MGMFDTIRDVLFCPFCGTKQEEDSFQTKDLSKSMTSYYIKSFGEPFKLNIYTECVKCNKWIELWINKDKVIIGTDNERG